MSPEAVGALIGLVVYFGMRLIDAMIPRGTHFTFTEKFMSNNNDNTEEIESDEQP